MKLINLLKNRRRTSQLFYNGFYHLFEYKMSIFNTISEYIMCDVLGMSYYWYHVKSTYFVKVFDLEDLLSAEEKGGV